MSGIQTFLSIVNPSPNCVLRLPFGPFRNHDFGQDSAQASVAPRLFWQLHVFCVRAQGSRRENESEPESKAEVLVSKRAYVETGHPVQMTKYKHLNPILVNSSTAELTIQLAIHEKELKFIHSILFELHFRFVH